MLLLGHAGITLGAAVLLAGTPFGRRLPKSVGKEAIRSSGWHGEVVPGSGNRVRYKVLRLDSLARHVDIRFLLTGALLPDIIDKPVGLLLFRETFSNGRIFCHTLLLLTLITLVGVYLYRHHSKTGLLALSFGTFTHLIFDQMGHSPRTLFWPIYGFAFERIDLTDWIANILYTLVTDPAVYVPELVGVAIVIWLAKELVARKRVFAFLRCGKVH